MFSQYKNKGFSIFTLIVSIGVVAVLAVGIFVYLNPGKRLGESYNARRWADIQAIARAVELYGLDNQALPSDFSTTSLSTSNKFVLCDAESSLECDGETLGCLVVNDTDFLGKYLETLPVDPLKSDDSDTGYYVSRSGDNMLVIGACDTYNNESISMIARASLPDYVPLAVCGNGDVESGEVCDDGDTVTETQTCGNSVTESGTYCNADCSATVVLNEACDDGDAFTEGCGNGTIETAGTYCNNDCTAQIVLSATETCDHNGAGGCWDDATHKQYYNRAVNNGCGKNDVLCASDCTQCVRQCLLNP